MFRHFRYSGRAYLVLHAAFFSAHSAFPVVAQVSAPPLTFKLSYDSAFANYKPLRDLSVGSWRDANDTVTNVGGWREYLKEVQRANPSAASPTGQPAAPTAPPPVVPPVAAPAAKPTTNDPHAGHRRPQ